MRFPIIYKVFLIFSGKKVVAHAVANMKTICNHLRLYKFLPKEEMIETCLKTYAKQDSALCKTRCKTQEAIVGRRANQRGKPS